MGCVGFYKVKKLNFQFSPCHSYMVKLGFKPRPAVSRASALLGHTHTCVCVWLCVCVAGSVCVCSSVVSNSIQPYELYVVHQASLSMEFFRQEYWSCHALLQGIFLTQGSNLDLLHCRQTIF